MRLRSILRRRRERPGPRRDHQRWPNAYFAERGLFSLITAQLPPVSPDEETTNWRAGCGRSASPVRREGGRKAPLPNR